MAGTEAAARATASGSEIDAQEHEQEEHEKHLRYVAENVGRLGRSAWELIDAPSAIINSLAQRGGQERVRQEFIGDFLSHRKQYYRESAEIIKAKLEATEPGVRVRRVLPFDHTMRGTASAGPKGKLYQGQEGNDDKQKQNMNARDGNKIAAP